MFHDGQLPMTEYSDEELFLKYIKGDAYAFDTLLNLYRTRVYRLILGYMKDQALAEDVFQEVFFKIIRKKDQFKESISFKSWMYTICRTTCLDALRKRVRHREEPIEKAPDRSSTPDLGQGVVHQEMMTLVMELPEEQAEVLALKVWGDWSVDEIAQMVESSPHTIKSRLRYALKALREKFEKRKDIKGSS